MVGFRTGGKFSCRKLPKEKPQKVDAYLVAQGDKQQANVNVVDKKQGAQNQGTNKESTKGKNSSGAPLHTGNEISIHQRFESPCVCACMCVCML